MSFVLALPTCTRQVVEQVTMPPRDVSVAIRSIEVQPFAGDARGRGTWLASEIASRLAREGYIEVRSGDAEATLGGTLSLGRVDTRRYSTTRKVTKKKDGRKYETTERTYHVHKTLPASVTYAVQRGGQAVGGNSIRLDYDREFSGGSSSEATARADDDEAIVLGQLAALASVIVAGVSPHRESWSFELQRGPPMGGNRDLKAGVEYYEQELFAQAESYWQRVVGSGTPKDVAAASYNLGVLRMREGRYEDAFAMFREADRLDPGKRAYMDALKRVDRAGSGQRDLERIWSVSPARR